MPMRKHGFTLIELSIVLVIIGLLVGGVLVGRDLIKAAEIRATVGQVEKFRTAVNTFRVKYNCLPGDCANASTFGLNTPDYGGAAINGNGNEDFSDGNDIVVFWVHLANAHLIESIDPATLKPISKLGGYWALTTCNVPAAVACPTTNDLKSGANYFALYLQNTASFCNADECPLLKPQDAYAIDVKLDDGMPYTGSVKAIGSFTDFYDATTTDSFADAGGPASDFCIANDVTPAQYNIRNTKPNLCLIAAETGF